MKHNQYKSNESFKHYLIKKVNPADYSDVKNDDFLEFFMNLGPGYLKKSENLDLFNKVKRSLHVLFNIIKLEIKSIILKGKINSVEYHLS